MPIFSKLSKALRVKKHDVWDKEGKKHTLEGSVETKGLLGTDGRKYVLDLYRLTPLDIVWLEAHWVDGSDAESKPKEHNYPHRMAVLRPELVEAYWRLKMTEFIKNEVEKRRNESEKFRKPDVIAGEGAKTSTDGEKPDSEDPTVADKGDKPETADTHERIDVADFNLAFNSDVFCGQIPQTDEEKVEWARDEIEIRALCKHLSDSAIPELVRILFCGIVLATC